MSGWKKKVFELTRAEICFFFTQKLRMLLDRTPCPSRISFFSFWAISLHFVPPLKLANRCMATGWAGMSKMHISKFIPFSTHNLRIATLCRKQNDSDQKILPFHKTKSAKNKVWSHQQTLSSFWGDVCKKWQTFKFFRILRKKWDQFLKTVLI